MKQLRRDCTVSSGPENDSNKSVFVVWHKMNWNKCLSFSRDFRDLKRDIKIPQGHYSGWTFHTVALQEGKQSRTAMTLHIIGGLQWQADRWAWNHLFHIHNGQRQQWCTVHDFLKPLQPRQLPPLGSVWNSRANCVCRSVSSKLESVSPLLSCGHFVILASSFLWWLEPSSWTGSIFFFIQSPHLF